MLKEDFIITNSYCLDFELQKLQQSLIAHYTIYL